MKSETLSDINVNYLDQFGNKIDTKDNLDIQNDITENKHNINNPSEIKQNPYKNETNNKRTTDTDYYFNMIANQEKINVIHSESSELYIDSDNSKSSASKKSLSSNDKFKKDNKPYKEQIHDQYQENYNESEHEQYNEHYHFNDNFHDQQKNFNEPYRNTEQYRQNEPYRHNEQSRYNEPYQHTEPYQHNEYYQNNESYQNKIPEQNSKNDNKLPNIPNIEPTISPQSLSPQEIRMKKIELLRRLSEIKTKGYSLTKEYNFDSSIDEMEYEYALLKSFADKRNGTKLYKNILLNGISLIEFLNDKYDPFDFKLNGWSDHMNIDIDSYDDIIEELYEKYKSTGKSTPPEIRLMFLLFASGAAFHFSKSQLGNIPGISSAASGMIGKMMAGDKKTSQFMTEQEINLEKQKELLRAREREIKMKLKNNSNTHNNTNTHNHTNIPNIQSPSNIPDILNRIKTIQKQNNINIDTDTPDTQDTQDTQNSRLISESTISDKKKGKKNKKSLIKVDTL